MLFSFFFFLEPYHWNYIGNEIQIYIFYRFEIFIILEDRDWCMHVRSPGFFMFVTCHTVAKMWSLQTPLHACGCFFCTVMHFWLPRRGCWRGRRKKGKKRKEICPLIFAFIISDKDSGDARWAIDLRCSSQTFHDTYIPHTTPLTFYAWSYLVPVRSERVS